MVPALHGDSHDFSASATAQLVEEFGVYLTSGRLDRNARLRAALCVLCRETHTFKIGPAQTLKTVMDLWTTLPQLAHLDQYVTATAYFHVRSECLNMYYGTAPT